MESKHVDLRVAAALQVVADDDCDAIVRILDEHLDPISEITLAGTSLDMTIARLLFIRDMRLGLLPGPTDTVQ